MAAPQGFTIQIETGRFNDHIRRLTSQYPGKVNTILKAYAFDLLRGIIGNTNDYKHPVDTGRARAGWYIAARGLGMPWPEEGNDNSGIAEGKGKGGYKAKLTGDNRYIEMINTVKYILFLEYGSSMQAPNGMVRINMRRITGGQMPNTMGQALQAEWRKFY